MDSASKPSVLFLYFTYTQQTLKVLDAMADVLRGRGCEVTWAAIEFTRSPIRGPVSNESRCLTRSGRCWG